MVFKLNYETNELNVDYEIIYKNMVCNRCNLAVADVLGKFGFGDAAVSLGEVDFGNIELSQNKLSALQKEL